MNDSRTFYSTQRRNNFEAASWRKRVERRNAIYDQLDRVGELAKLLGGSLLLAPDLNGVVQRLDSSSSWRETFESGEILRFLNEREISRFRKMNNELYTQLELLNGTLGRVLSLALDDLNEPRIISSCLELKLWSIRTTLKHQDTDDVALYYKWVAKAAQSAFLGSEIPELPPVRPGKLHGCIIPFDGDLRFISDFLLGRRNRSDGIKLSEARKLAQVSSISRALPYPSDSMIKQDIERVVELTTNKPSQIDDETLTSYRRGLAAVKATCGPKVLNLRTHISLSTSGCLENSSSQGGRGRYLVRLAKQASSFIINKDLLLKIQGKKDIFNRDIWPPENTEVMLRMLEEDPNFVPLLGHYIYNSVADFPQIKKDNSVKPLVPRKLTDILNNVCSADLLKYGSYSINGELHCGLLLFKDATNVEFNPSVTSLPVKADVSIESGLKSRLVTAQSASVVHFGQQLGHVLRDYLSKDNFLRVGFEEADKLWDTLKYYGKRFPKKEDSSL